MEEAMPAAMSIELFHNFTLMHDDIMDEAPLRRGRPTVHKKWSENAAILSGDAMYTLALTALEAVPSHALPAALSMFNATAREEVLMLKRIGCRWKWFDAQDKKPQRPRFSCSNK